MLGAVARSAEWELVPGVELSGALGLMGSVGAPLLAEDLPVVGSPQLGFVPLAEARVRISRRVEVRISPKLICFESFYRHVTDLRGQATQDISRARMCTAFLGVGMAGTW